MKTTLLCSLLAFSAPCLFAADLAALAENESKLEHAALRSDADALKPLVAQAEADLAAAPSDPALQYERAFAYYAEASVSRARQEKEQAAKSLDTAMKILEKISDPAWEVEAMALRGYLMNQMIGLKGMSSAMSYGPKSSALLSKAKTKAPANPRVQFFNGVVLITTPEMFGGDLAGGIGAVEGAVASYDRASGPAVPRWGEAEALAWLGIAKQKTGDAAGAKAAWERALAIEPEYGWVKYVLLPSLEKTAAGAKK